VTTRSLPLLFSAAALVAGCASSYRAVDAGELARSKPRTLLLVVLGEQRFHGPSRAAAPGFDASGVAATLEMRDAEQLGAFHLTDPAPSVGDGLASRFARTHGLTFWTIKERLAPPVARGGTPPAPPTRPGTDLALEVRSIDWGLAKYGVTDAETYTTYAVDVKLVDNRSRRVLADGVCRGDPQRTSRPMRPFAEHLLNEGLLRGEAAEAVSYCADEIARKVLGL
jgi:hypothetical protein